MNISKLLVLPTLFIASVVSAESVRMRMNCSQNDTNESCDQVVNFQDGESHVFHNEAQTRKVECVKDGDIYKFTVSMKENDEWKIVSTPEIVLGEAEGKLEISDDEGSVFSLILEKLAE